jgi:hypothetical protein
VHWDELLGVYYNKEVSPLKKRTEASLKKILFLFLALIFSSSAFSYVDLNLSYTYSISKVDGVETDLNPDPGAARTTTVGYVLNWAWFMWEYTALELNYSQTTQTLLDDREVNIEDAEGNPFTIIEQENTVITQVSGVGIRQAFAGRKSRIVPTLAIGYAKYTTSGTKRYKFDSNGTKFEFEEEQDKEIFSSSYASFSLRFKISQLMGLTVAAKTVMPDFDTSAAENNMTYSAGLSWMF